MMTAATKFYNGFFFRDGTGVVATLTNGDITSTTTGIEVSDARMLWEGGTYEVRDVTTPATLHGTFTLVNRDTDLDANGDALIEISNTVAGAAAGDLIVWENSLNKAITGLDALIGDDQSSGASLQNVALDTKTNNSWTSMVVDNGGTNEEMTPTKFRTLLAGIRQKAGKKKKPLKVLGDAWQAIEFEEMYDSELRLAPSDKTSGAAVTSFQSALGRIDLDTDTDALRNTLFCIDPSQLVHYKQRELGWVPERNGGIFKQSHVSGVQTAVMLCISQLAILERYTSGRIDDLSDEATVRFG
jgi:hypothetical protein